MIEIIWQYDPTSQEGKPAPATANEACRLLESGNRDFAELLAKHHEMQNARKVIKRSWSFYELPTTFSRCVWPETS
jgi:hypothetical protein